MARIPISENFHLGFAETGGGGSLPIIFLHGVGSDKSVWAPQLDHFERSRRALAFDYPGYGESHPAPDGTTRDDYAAAILSAMDALGIGRAHVCGLSLGGVVAIAIHHAEPQRCASLVIADSFAVHPDGQGIYDRSIAASTDMAALAEARTPVLVAPGTNQTLQREVRDVMGRIDPAAFRIGAEAVWLADQRDRVADIHIPALVLCGGEDKVTPPDLSHQLAAMIPGSTVAIIDGAGHLSNIEQPEAFNRLVDAFIKSAEY